MHHVQLADADALDIVFIAGSPVHLPPQQQLQLEQEELLKGHAVLGSFQVVVIHWFVHVCKGLQHMVNDWPCCVKLKDPVVLAGLRLWSSTGLCVCVNAKR